MPAGGLIPDSPWLYYGGKLWRSASKRTKGRAPGRGSYKRTTINYKFKDLIIYKPVLNFELTHRYGMVGQHLHKAGNRILMGAKRQVGVKTGALRKSLKITHLNIGSEAAVKIGSELSYAYIHHEGVRPHLITPKEANGVLVFKSGARLVRTSLVRHPGTRPNRYLTDQLALHVRR